MGHEGSERVGRCSGCSGLHHGVAAQGVTQSHVEQSLEWSHGEDARIPSGRDLAERVVPTRRVLRLKEHAVAEKVRRRDIQALTVHTQGAETDPVYLAQDGSWLLGNRLERDAVGPAQQARRRHTAVDGPGADTGYVQRSLLPSGSIKTAISRKPISRARHISGWSLGMAASPATDTRAPRPRLRAYSAIFSACKGKSYGESGQVMSGSKRGGYL